MVQFLRLWLTSVLVIRKTPVRVAKTYLRSMCCSFQGLLCLCRKKVLVFSGSLICMYVCMYIYQLSHSSPTVTNAVLSKPGFWQDGCPVAHQQLACKSYSPSTQQVSPSHLPHSCPVPGLLVSKCRHAPTFKLMQGV